MGNPMSVVVMVVAEVSATPTEPYCKCATESALVHDELFAMLFTVG